MVEELYTQALKALSGVDVLARPSALAEVIGPSKVPPEEAVGLAVHAHRILSAWDPAHGFEKLSESVEIALFVKSYEQSQACAKAVNLLATYVKSELSAKDWLEVETTLECILRYVRSEQRTDAFDYKCLHRLVERTKSCLPLTSKTDLLTELLKNRTASDLGGTIKINVAVDVMIGAGTPQSTQDEMQEAIRLIFSRFPIEYWAKNIRDVDFRESDQTDNDQPKKIFLRSIFHVSEPMALVLAIPSLDDTGPDLLLVETQCLSNIRSVNDLTKTARSKGASLNVSDFDESYIEDFCAAWGQAWAAQRININSGNPPSPILGI